MKRWGGFWAGTSSIALILFAVYFSSHQAVFATGLEGDLMCAACQMDPTKPLYCPTVPCMDITSGFPTVGHCVLPAKCLATGTGGLNGFGTDILKSVLGSLMQKLMSGSGSGSGSDSGAGSVAPTSGTTGCAQYYNVTTPTPQDPCAIYQSPVSDSIGTTGSNSAAVSDYLNQLAIDTNTNTNVSDALSVQRTQTPTIVPEQTPTTTVVVTPTQPSESAGVRGDILLLNNGGTVLAASVDLDKSSVTAGFYGGDSFTNKPTGVVAGICQNRPWQKSVLSYVIPPAFFDTLCTLRGYTVGAPMVAPAPQVKLVQKPIVPAISTSSVFTSDVPPGVDIWAVPESVALGSRTSIFWSSQGVRDCTETSSDNSFSQTTLSGSASALPFTSDRTFTISCKAPDGSEIKSSVVVYIAQ